MRLSLYFLLVSISCGLSAPNLIQNSSFECGTENWISYGPGCCNASYGWIGSPSTQITSTNKTHGSNSMMFPKSRGITQPVHMLTGNYAFTFDAMASSAIVLSNLICRDDYVTPPADGGSNPGPTLTTSWARYTNYLTITSNGFYSMRFYRASQTPDIWIDSVKLETGTVASAWSPTHTVEIGLGSTNPVHMLRGTSPTIQLRCWNDGSAIGMTSIVSFFDYSNTNFYSVTVSTNSLAAGATAINIAVPSRYGALRAMAYQPDKNRSEMEMLFSYLPHPKGSLYNTNGVLGLHSTYGPFAQTQAVNAGFAATRDLSPARCVRWTDQQTSKGGPFNFTSGASGSISSDECAGNMATNGLVPLFVLTPGLDGAWPTWATNASGAADTNDWWIYCWTNAIRYSVAPYNVHYWEIGNEWQGITTPTDFANSASNRARFGIVGAQAVRAACPNCTIVGIAGEYDASQGFQTWTNMTNMVASPPIDIIAAHIYAWPQNPNLTDDDLSRSAAAIIWAQTFAGVGKPMWNTECGAKGGRGGNLGIMKMSTPLAQMYGTPTPEASRDYMGGQRMITSVYLETRQILRTLGVGFKKVFTYTSDNPSDNLWFAGFNAQTMEFNGALRRGTTAILIGANYFAQYAGLGRVTNVTAGVLQIEAYYFTNTLGTVIAIWSSDNTERTLSCTNGSFAQCDVMGNYLITNSTSVIINRTPMYLVTGSLITSQIKATIENATPSNYSDITGPTVSVDVTPIGVVTNDTFFFKWTVLDRNKQVWSINDYTPDETNNRSRVKFFHSDTWRDVGVSNHVFAPLTINRQYNCIVEGKDFYNNITTVTGASFGMLESGIPPIQTTINVGTLNIGTITVVAP